MYAADMPGDEWLKQVFGKYSFKPETGFKACL